MFRCMLGKWTCRDQHPTWVWEATPEICKMKFTDLIHFPNYLGSQNYEFKLLLYRFHLLIIAIWYMGWGDMYSNQAHIVCWNEKCQICWQSLMKMIDWMFALLNFWFSHQTEGAFLFDQTETNLINFSVAISWASHFTPQPLQSRVHHWFCWLFGHLIAKQIFMHSVWDCTLSSFAPRWRNMKARRPPRGLGNPTWVHQSKASKDLI